MEDGTEQIEEVKKGGTNKSILPIIFILLVIIGVVALVHSKTDVDTIKSAGSTQSVEAQNKVVSNDSYKDGTYNSVGNYLSPGGDESIEVKLTLKNNLITEANVVSDATRPNSKRFQSMFIDGYKQYVIGKNINEVKLDKVSGSSLTPMGFNDAVEKIKAEAKV